MRAAGEKALAQRAAPWTIAPEDWSSDIEATAALRRLEEAAECDVLVQAQRQQVRSAWLIRGMIDW